MTGFDSLLKVAEKKVGGVIELEKRLPSVKSSKQLAVLGDDRYLSAMTRCVFRAGFVWKVIENKWPGFEAAFSGFNPLAVAHFSDEKLEQLAKDEQIVRNLQKISATRKNAQFVLDVAEREGSFGKWVADWPVENIVGLWMELKKRGARLGGNSGPGMLRLVGKDTFMLSEDVKAALINHGYMDTISPNSKRDLNKVQLIFNEFQQQSGRPLAEISRILAHTV